MSKLLERCAYEQLTSYLTDNGLLPELQSAYTKNRSTETAVLKVLSDAYAAADDRKVTLLSFLDLSAAFDTVDHGILMQRLRFSFGMGGSVLDWIRSYLEGRTQYVRYDGAVSTTTIVLFGVPQGFHTRPSRFQPIYVRYHPVDQGDGFERSCVRR